MPESRPLTFLCITTYEKGQEFMRECKREGCRVLLLTAEKLRDADWPRESLHDTFYLPAEIPLADIVQAVTHLARTQKIDRIVALDEYDMETAATLREHLRVPGMGLTTMRYFRDKLAMRMKALERDVRVPDFVPVVNHQDIRYYLEHVAGPWVLKPRQEASAIGIKKIHAAEELWPVLEELGDKQSSFLLEKFVPGEVYHVDSVVSENEIVFANVSKYGKPPMNVAQGGGVFTTFTVARDSKEDSGLRQINRDLIAALGLVRGVAHAEFIRAHADGHFYFLECAARVGGAYINEMVEAATGINLWREWARIEVAGGDGSYQVPPTREEYAGVILSLARQENPDTSAFNVPEVFLRIKKHHHAGLILRSTDQQRVQSLLEGYSQRFVREFLAVEPPREKPTA
ncbi:MAG: ATP-dependent carboxylate-amine ligase domain protein ATP-grasp [Candidatus Sulfotelmatobacter sp.]|nr:ATP-dependent carboxylate-amine ligase domain protein ATP-grasp [Candidatus Sulfotelmatobacter sp.]